MGWKLSRKLRESRETGSGPEAGVPQTPTTLLPDSALSPNGVLTVTLYECEGLSVDEKTRECFNGDDHGSQKPYAVVDYDKSQVSVPASSGTVGSLRWGCAPGLVSEQRLGHILLSGGIGHKFDVVRAAELAIHLYLWDPTVEGGSQHTSLVGTASLSIFDRLKASGRQWIALQNGAGRVHIDLTYEHVCQDLFGPNIDSRLLLLSMWSGGLKLYRKKDTDREYAVKRVEATSVAAGRHIDHPFITPLLRTVQSTSREDCVELIAPFMTGGNVLDHLQTAGRFDIETARILAAEIVCALGYLHQHHSADVAGWLKPGNVMLDAEGHVSLSGFGLFQTRFRGRQDGGGRRSAPEYPALELLLGGDDCETSEETADWWTLGVLLFEMLTGLPPFYAADAASIRQHILNGAPTAPGWLPPTARNVLGRLLDPQPATRLGAAGGATEVQAHPFFAGVDWVALARRAHAPAVARPPHTTAGPLRHYGLGYPADEAGRRTLQDALRESSIVYTCPGALPELPATSSSDEGFVCGSEGGDDRRRGHEYVVRSVWLRMAAARGAGGGEPS